MENSLNLPAQSGSGIGQQIRRLRHSHRMSLQEVSDLSGIAVSTLSKIENGIVELSYTRMIAISEALGINLTELVADSQAGSASAPSLVTARRSVTKSGAGSKAETKNYVYEYLNTDISKKHMVPTIAVVKPRTLAEYGPLVTHKGEEFVIILEGEVELHTEHYSPLKLTKGDSLYIDSTMPHAMISTSRNLARILFVCTHAIADEPAAEGPRAARQPGRARSRAPNARIRKAAEVGEGN